MHDSEPHMKLIMGLSTGMLEIPGNSEENVGPQTPQGTIQILNPKIGLLLNPIPFSVPPPHNSF